MRALKRSFGVSLFPIGLFNNVTKEAGQLNWELVRYELEDIRPVLMMIRDGVVFGVKNKMGLLDGLGGASLTKSFIL